MRQTHLWIAASIIAGIILVSFMLSVPHTRDSASEKISPATTSSVPKVALNDSFKKGLHTISGSIEVPNACTEVQVEATLVTTSSSTQNILLAIKVPPNSGICLQEKTIMKFLTTITAPAAIPLVATVNDVAATTTEL